MENNEVIIRNPMALNEDALTDDVGFVSSLPPTTGKLIKFFHYACGDCGAHNCICNRESD